LSRIEKPYSSILKKEKKAHPYHFQSVKMALALMSAWYTNKNASKALIVAQYVGVKINIGSDFEMGVTICWVEGRVLENMRTCVR
jgi:hypothetical protein